MRRDIIYRLAALLSLALFTSAFSLAPADAAQVAVTVEKLTLGEGYIVEPTLVTLSGSQTAEDVTKSLLTSRFPGVTAYKSGGSGDSFYLKGVYDPSRGGLLSEFSLGSKSGWMITVNNFFIRASAGTDALSDGDVIRWQYTTQLGSDLGEDTDHLGANTKADKGALIWKVAEINAAGNKTAYGGAHAAAVSALTDLNAAQTTVDSALAALNAATPGGGGNNNDNSGDNNDNNDSNNNDNNDSNDNNDNNDSNGDESDGGGNKNVVEPSSGGGGGCSTGVFGVSALAVLGFMTVRGRGRQNR
jgi:hypothetical protein